MGIMLDSRNYGGIMFNESSFSHNNPLSTYDYNDEEYLQEDYYDGWERNLDQNIDSVLIEFRDSSMYKKATKGMSAKRRDEFDKELKLKVKNKIYEKQEKVSKIFTAFGLAGLIVAIFGLFVSFTLPILGANIVLMGWGIEIITMIAVCIRYIVGADDIRRSDIKKILEEIVEDD